MIRIDKGQEPPQWLQFRKTPGAQFQASPELRESLIKEQGYLCAYCMRRINYTPGKTTSTRVEHMRSQSDCDAIGKPELKLDYRNLVLCCCGKSSGQNHCDVNKGEQSITFNLFDQNFIDTLSYAKASGKLLCQNPTHRQQIDDMLNLNNKPLMRSRAEALFAVRQLLAKNYSPGLLKKLLQAWENKNQEGKYQPFAGIVIWYLRKKLTDLQAASGGS